MAAFLLFATSPSTEFSGNYRCNYSYKIMSTYRIYRNEAVDATHLCEFHQVEGMVKPTWKINALVIIRKLTNI